MVEVIPILSIIIISHEQCEQLRRCIESIMTMRIAYPYEIIISDDRSSDGSFELAVSYVEAWENRQIEKNNIVRIVAVQCDSDECDPAYNSDRSGYNRCNAYPHARGKYMVHVDADDFFIPQADVYNKQIRALEEHPECALAMSKHLYLQDGRSICEAEEVGFKKALKDGDIITAEDFIKSFYFHLNQAFMLRRNAVINPIDLYGKKYVDSVITYHHLQFGSIVYVEACDYVYVQYEKSITGQMESLNQDSRIMWGLALYIPSLIPYWRKLFMEYQYDSIRSIIRMAKDDYMLAKHNYEALKCLDMWIYECFGRHITRIDKVRLRLFLIVQRMQKQNNLYGNKICDMVWKMLK